MFELLVTYMVTHAYALGLSYYFYICKSVFWSNSMFKGNIFVNVMVLKI